MLTQIYLNITSFSLRREKKNLPANINQVALAKNDMSSTWRTSLSPQILQNLKQALLKC